MSIYVNVKITESDVAIFTYKAFPMFFNSNMYKVTTRIFSLLNKDYGNKTY